MNLGKRDSNRDHFLPDFCNIKVVFGVVVFAQFLAFLLQLASASLESGFWAGLGLKSLFILWVALLSTALLCNIRPLIRRLPNPWTAFIAFTCVQLITLLVSWVSRDLLSNLGLLSSLVFEHDPWTFYVRNLGISSLIAIVFLHYLDITHQRDKQIRAESDAKMMAMQSRIRPHFLFNSLNTVASLTRANPALAEELVQDLAELFRAILKSEDKFISLKAEFNLVEQYLNIEKSRLDNRLKIEWNVDDAPGNAQIPPLILQPLVENAVHHGIEPAVDGGTVSIEANLHQEKIILIVKNSVSEEIREQTRKGNKMAVDNIKARLETCFPEQAKIVMSRGDNVYQVRIVFPYTKANAT